MQNAKEVIIVDIKKEFRIIEKQLLNETNVFYDGDSKQHKEKGRRFFDKIYIFIEYALPLKCSDQMVTSLAEKHFNRMKNFNFCTVSPNANLLFGVNKNQPCVNFSIKHGEDFVEEKHLVDCRDLSEHEILKKLLELFEAFLVRNIDLLKSIEEKDREKVLQCLHEGNYVSLKRLAKYFEFSERRLQKYQAEYNYCIHRLAFMNPIYWQDYERLLSGKSCMSPKENRNLIAKINKMGFGNRNIMYRF